MDNRKQRKRGGRAGRLSGRVALITGGESNLGRAVADLFAREGAGITVACSREAPGKAETRKFLQDHEKTCLLLEGDQADTCFCIDAVERTFQKHGGLDILVNSVHSAPEDAELRHKPFGQGLLSTVIMTQSALFYLTHGSVIVNTIPFEPRQSPRMVNYLAARLAVTNFTKTLARELSSKGIRVNAVAPETAEPDALVNLEPETIAPSYLFLACEDSSLVTGQVLYHNGSLKNPY